MLEVLSYYKTQNSDEWVDHTFRIQERYARVLVVDGSNSAPETIRVAPLDLNAKHSAKAPHEYRVSKVFDSLQKAADAAEGGDLVAVMPGRYEGFVLGDKRDAEDGRYIHFKAMDEPGDVIIDRPSPRVPESAQISEIPKGIVILQAAHHVIFQGFNIDGGNAPDCEPHGPYSGIKMEGNFAKTGKMANHIVITNCFSHHNRTWGMLTTETHTVLFQDNCFGWSREQHSCYISDGSDNYVVRRNGFYGSPRSGLQCNMDPPCSLSKVAGHPDMQEYVAANPTVVKHAYALDGNEACELPSRDWALGLIDRATERFGENNFPDGKGLNFIIESNVINENGTDGAGSMNLSGIQDSLIQNNLIYGNFSHGIALWHGPNPYDVPFIAPGPQAPVQVQSPLDLPLFGCQRNLIRNNTVLMNREGRAAMQCRNGSWGNRIWSNIFINDEAPSIQIYNTSIYKYDGSFNVVNTIDFVEAVDAHSDDTRPMQEGLKSLATRLDDRGGTALGITRERVAAEFERYNEEPWVVLEDTWWSLNPERPDFRPRVNSSLLQDHSDPEEVPAADLLGRPREEAWIGAFGPRR